MKSVFTGATGTAALLAGSMAVFAQSTAQPPTQQRQPTGTDQQITVAGCVQNEADYRRMKGGAASSTTSPTASPSTTPSTSPGTSAGATASAASGSQFVLVQASTSTGSTATGTSPAAGAATGTTGSGGSAYQITGSEESQLSKHVGKRVEVVGKLKSATSAYGTGATGTGATGTGATGAGATGAATGTTPERPSTSAGSTGQALNIPELEIVSVREVAGTCTPMQ